MLRSIETTDISKDISWSGFHIRKFILATVKNGMKQRNIGDNLSRWLELRRQQVSTGAQRPKPEEAIGVREHNQNWWSRGSDSSLGLSLAAIVSCHFIFCRFIEPLPGTNTLGRVPLLSYFSVNSALLCNLKPTNPNYSPSGFFVDYRSEQTWSTPFPIDSLDPRPESRQGHKGCAGMGVVQKIICSPRSGQKYPLCPRLHADTVCILLGALSNDCSSGELLRSG